MGVRTRIAAVSALALAGSVLVAGQADAGGHQSSLRPVIAGLDSPRGIALHDGKIIYSVGDGSVYSKSGRKTVLLGKLPGGFAPAIDTDRWGRTYALTGAGGEPGAPLTPGSATLYRLRPGKSPVVVADIGKYQAKDPDPYNTNGPADESNPFGVAALRDGTVLVSDAAGNDLLRVWPNGKIKTVARLKPRLVKTPPNRGPDAPPPGTPILAEAVATSVTVGSDGYWYVGELRGFPATPRTSEIWRIKPGSVGAVCNPVKPSKGNCTRFADGYTSIVDLGGAPHGAIAVVELAKRTWFEYEAGGFKPIEGSLFLQYPGKHHKPGFKKELARGKVLSPGGTAVSRSGDFYVSFPLFGPGAIYKVK